MSLSPSSSSSSPSTWISTLVILSIAILPFIHPSWAVPAHRQHALRPQSFRSSNFGSSEWDAHIPESFVFEPEDSKPTQQGFKSVAGYKFVGFHGSSIDISKVANVWISVSKRDHVCFKAKGVSFVECNYQHELGNGFYTASSFTMAHMYASDSGKRKGFVCATFLPDSVVASLVHVDYEADELASGEPSKADADEAILDQQDVKMAQKGANHNNVVKSGPLAGGAAVQYVIPEPASKHIKAQCKETTQ
ncbi:hypothetical protein HDU97_006017 [Phlyctochytrium planicorne]|nr:hypothetical protein HDU97_006017 [Phlyctochytrium planicorne]